MSTSTTAIFLEIIDKAYNGSIKLPAFQRKWKWSKKQVMALYESLRQGYPIGSFLFMTSEQSEKLNPKNFYGSRRNDSLKSNDALVLDGQQRITAGISIFYGVQEPNGIEYYINVEKIIALVDAQKIDLENDADILRFSNRIDLEDGYITAKPKRQERLTHYHESKLLWTAYLTENQSDRFDELLEGITDVKEKKILRKVIRKHFKPNLSTTVPVINLGKEFDLSAISKIFTTINTTGKLLTPFELVVAILYAEDIKLEEEVAIYKSTLLYYPNIDRNGEVLLQTIALLANQSPKKSDLPKNITGHIYTQHSYEAVTVLEKLGEWLTNGLGVGLDICNNLIPYDAIYAPLAIVFNSIENKKSHIDQSKAKKKLKKWFIGAALDQRYQEGVHNKQSSDVVEFTKWLEDDSKEPEWLKEVTISASIKRMIPNGAVGRLFKCMINANNPKDPILDESIGYKVKYTPTELHHIFPTKWVMKGLTNYNDGIRVNVAFNTMFLAKKTNADWLNFDPKDQINQSLLILKSVDKVIEALAPQFINKNAVAILQKGTKTVEDYEQFLEERYLSFTLAIKEYGFKESKEDFQYEDDEESADVAT